LKLFPNTKRTRKQSGTVNTVTKGKSCLTSRAAFCDELIGYADEGRAVDVIHVDFSKASDTASHSICIWKLREYWLEEQPARH